MKFGIRKPSPKKMIKARTTGKIKRQVKSSINPLYGKKGMGWINNPKKAAYNKVYNKTTVSTKDILNNSSELSKEDIQEYAINSKIKSDLFFKYLGIPIYIFGAFSFLCGLLIFDILLILLGIFLISITYYQRKKFK